VIPQHIADSKRLGISSARPRKALRAKTGRFNETNLIAPGREFTALITLNHHTATGFDPNDAGTNPAKGGGFEHFYDIAGL